MTDDGNSDAENTFNTTNGESGTSKTVRICCVKNCGNGISEGTGMRIGDRFYCAACGAAIVKDSMGL